MLLRADLVRLAHPGNKRIVDVARVLEAKRVQVVAWGERFDLPESRMLQAAGENHVAVEPALARGYLGKRHPDLKRNACLLGEDDDGAEGAHGGSNKVVQLADDGLSADEMVVEVVETAGVGLIAVGEHSLALRAAPERVAGSVAVGCRSWHGLTYGASL